MKKISKIMLAYTLVVVMLICSVTLSYAAENDNLAVGEHVYFGSYPQTQITDAETVTVLNELAPDWNEWISYNYYSGTGDVGTMSSGDWMRYIDIECNGEKYRGVKFTYNRPYPSYATLESVWPEHSYQYDNGYRVNTIYWFKFEKLSWRILDAETGLVMSEIIIDSQPYSNEIYEAYNDEKYENSYYNSIFREKYASDYETSSIRNWLNCDFFDTAFTTAEKEQISTTTLNNDGYYTLTGETGYVEDLDSGSTNDKIFLLSYDEVQNEAYGFNSSSDRVTTGSDYAKSQGLYYREADPDFFIPLVEGAKWSLRSAGASSLVSCGVSHAGTIKERGFDVYYTHIGVRPALKFIQLSEIPNFSEQHTHTDNDNDGYCDDEECKENICTHETTTLTGKKESTCTADGYTGDKVCDKCGITVSEGTATEKLGHNFGSWTETKVPTCTEKGEERRDCSRCDYFESREIVATGHEDKDNDGYCDDEDCKENICTHESTTLRGKKDATCTAGGYTGDKVCNKCGITLSEGTATEKLGHNFGAWTVTKVPTCTEKGEERRDCSRCEYFESREVAETGHEDKDGDGYCDDEDCKENICEHKNTTLTGKKDATCTAGGYTGDKVCNKCGITVSEGTATEKLGHNFGSWTETKVPTCTEKGEERRDCSRCDYFEIREVAETGHEDKDGDGYCDRDGENMAVVNCKHFCHSKNFIIRIIWLIVRFFCKLFHINEFCSCGIAHY